MEFSNHCMWVPTWSSCWYNLSSRDRPRFCWLFVHMPNSTINLHIYLLPDSNNHRSNTWLLYLPKGNIDRPSKPATADLQRNNECVSMPQQNSHHCGHTNPAILRLCTENMCLLCSSSRNPSHKYMGFSLEFNEFVVWVPTQSNVQCRSRQEILPMHHTSNCSGWNRLAHIQCNKHKLWMPDRNHHELHIQDLHMHSTQDMEWISMCMTTMIPNHRISIIDRSISLG